MSFSFCVTSSHILNSELHAWLPLQAHTPPNIHAGEPKQTLTHISKEMSCRLWASCMAATEVLAVVGADGGESCGDGLAALTPICTEEIKRKKKNPQQPDCCCHLYH